MKQWIAPLPRTGLSLLLALQLLFPASFWAAADSRDLVVEEMKDTVTLWVLAIGVSEYADERISLQYADHDAMKIAQLLRTQEGLLFNEVFTRVLVNEQAGLHRDRKRQSAGRLAPDPRRSSQPGG